MGAAKSLCRLLFVAVLACAPVACGGCSCARQQTDDGPVWGFVEDEPNSWVEQAERERKQHADLVTGIQDQRARNEAAFRAANPGVQPRR